MSLLQLVRKTHQTFLKPGAEDWRYRRTVSSSGTEAFFFFQRSVGWCFTVPYCNACRPVTCWSSDFVTGPEKSSPSPQIPSIGLFCHWIQSEFIQCVFMNDPFELPSSLHPVSKLTAKMKFLTQLVTNYPCRFLGLLLCGRKLPSVILNPVVTYTDKFFIRSEVFTPVGMTMFYL
jgi:hypothetical protein